MEQIVETQATLKGNSYTDGVQLLAWGAAHHTDAAQVWDANGKPIIAILNPDVRGNGYGPWDSDSEASFRATVRQYVRGILETDDFAAGRYDLVFDPNTNRQESETMTVGQDA